jgi:hypothetical protein
MIDKLTDYTTLNAWIFALPCDAEITIAKCNIKDLLKNIKQVNSNRHVSIYISLVINDKKYLNKLVTNYKGYNWSINSIAVDQKYFHSQKLVTLLKAPLYKQMPAVNFLNYCINNLATIKAIYQNEELSKLSFISNIYIKVDHSTQIENILKLRNTIDNYFKLSKYQNNKYRYHLFAVCTPLHEIDIIKLISQQRSHE